MSETDIDASTEGLPDTGAPKVGLTPHALEINPAPNTPALVYRHYRRMALVLQAMVREMASLKPRSEKLAEYVAERRRRGAQLTAMNLKVPRSEADALEQAQIILDKMGR